MRTGCQRLMGRLKYREYLVTRDAWKIVEKLIEAVAFLEVIDKVTQWDPRSYKHRRAPENLRVTMDYRGASAQCMLLPEASVAQQEIFA